MIFKAFLVGGLLCMVGQILIDRTRLTPARILSGYVVAGVVLSALGLYQPLVDFAGAGATICWQKACARPCEPTAFLARSPAASPPPPRGLQRPSSRRFCAPSYSRQRPRNNPKAS